jgi:hypothetical protein
MAGGETGTIVSKTDSGERYLIGQSNLSCYPEQYALLRITLTGTVSRFTAEGSRDKFGITSTVAPIIIYPEVPMHLFPLDRSKPDSKPDRSDESTSYRFAAPGSYILQPKDQLNVGNQTLTITAILLLLSGITEFTATATA